MTTFNNRRIAIIGAGPGGLLCARVLQGHGIAVTVYDADTTVASRDGGGTLDLHADTGQIALEDAGLMEAFNALARVEGQAKSSRDHHGTVLAAFTPHADDTAAPEIDRGQLRSMLATHVRRGTVRWGHKLTSATPLGNGQHRLQFANGATDEVDLLIGADGAWSKVRPLLSDATPHYTGVSFLDARYTNVDVRHPHVAQLVGDGHMFSRDGDGHGILLQRNSDGVVRGYIGMRTDVDWYRTANVDLADPAAVRAYLLHEFRDWADAMLRLITEVDSAYVNRPLYALPAPLTWHHVPGVTLFGDAAHLMAPFGGFGVNLAMLDGAELAHALHEEPTIDVAITRYEQVMLPRADTLAVGANGGLARFFADDASNPNNVAASGPDHKAEHEQYRTAAADYRRQQALYRASSGQPNPQPVIQNDGRN